MSLLDDELIAVGHNGSMQQFLLGLLAGGSVLLLLWVAIFVILLGHPHVHNVWVDQAYEKKMQRVRELGTEPKIVVVAGSATMFGLDSKQLGLALGRPVVNMGVNAGIGPIHIVQRVKPAFNPGDVVLLPLEYPLYSFDWEINQVFLDYLLSYPGLIVSEPWTFWPRVLWATSVKRLYQAFLGVPEGFDAPGLYGAHNLDHNGDQINSALSDLHPDIHAGAANSAIEHYGKSFKREAFGWELWRAYYQSIIDMGGCVLFVPPPMLERQEYHDDPVERHFYQNFPDYVREAGLPYAGRPFDFMYPVSWFFDTNYHLVAEHKADYTQALANLVRRQHLACLAKDGGEESDKDN